MPRGAGFRACVAALVVFVAAASRADDAAVPAGAAETLRSGQFDPPRRAPDFRLRGSDGSDVTLARFLGKVVVLEFGFTHCPAVCPTTLATIARAHEELGSDAARVQLVYVTVDPEHDDAAHLREYLEKFDPSFIGATGSEDELAAVRASYGVQSAKTTDGGGYVHSSSVYLIDASGRLVALMPFGHTSEDYEHDLRLLVKNAEAGR